MGTNIKVICIILIVKVSKAKAVSVNWKKVMILYDGEKHFGEKQIKTKMKRISVAITYTRVTASVIPSSRAA